MSYFIYFVITIGILVFVHEFGHFIAAKMCKIRTDVFAIGFGKRLFGYNRINGFTFGALPDDLDLRGHTDYRLGLLPLGGYVKIVGMVDESFDTEFAKKEPQPWEFRSKNTLQKLFVISAGVLMNLFLTLAIFWGIFFFRGDRVLNSTEIGRVPAESIAANVGFAEGDVIQSINGEETKTWQDVSKLLTDPERSEYAIVLNRKDSTVYLNLTKDMMSDADGNRISLTVAPSVVSILKVIKDSPADTAGIIEGDVFLAINGTKIESDEDARKLIKANPDQNINVSILRVSDTLNVAVQPDMNGHLGVHLINMYNGPFEYRTFGFFESATRSVQYIVYIVDMTSYFLQKVITGDVEFGEAFGGPIRIAQFAAKSADSGLIEFLFFLAQLSLSLAIINILPFPALDGGHFIIILIEGIMRRELPLRIKIAIQNVGFIILLMLMAFIIYSDILRAF